MDEQENSRQEPGKPEHGSEVEQTESPVGDIELTTTEPEEEARKPGLFEAFRRSFERGWQAQRDPKRDKTSRQELRKDKTKSLLALAGFAGAMIVMFILVFSSPPKHRQLNQRPPGTPDLGQRVTPGLGGPQEHVTPLMNVTAASGEAGNNGLSTPQDVALTARPIQSTAATQSVPPSTGAPATHTLAQINFQDQALQEQYAMHGTNPPFASSPAPVKETEDLRTASLVFVRAQQQSMNAAQVKPAIEETAVMDLLPVGTHLVARLEAPVSTALQAPVVAVIEYNYEQDGQIILPAGTEVIGKLGSATPQGEVSLEFDELEFSDGTTQKIAASAMGLDYKPLKGHVTGRNRGLRFLVQSLTGVGEVAAYMVGGSPGSTSVFSEDALLREQLAANMATAGQQQFNQLAMTQHIVVTVPGNTRFYLVLEQGTTPKSVPASLRPVANHSSLPSEQELMELMELKRELTAVSQPSGIATAPAAAPTQP